MYYNFFTTTVNGVRLAVIKTSPNNIQLTYLGGQTVPGSGKIGINGGFFQDGTSHPDVYSIAVNNGTPVRGEAIDYYGSGGKQDTSRGTFAWDKTTQDYVLRSVTVGDRSNLWLAANDQYWAQGGISMSLKNDSQWLNIARQEGVPYNGDGQWYRSALLYSDSKYIFLVRSMDEVYLADFRTACKGVDSGIIDGIFLDGATASQMNVPGQPDGITGHTRPIAAMIEVVYNVDIDGSTPATPLTPYSPGYVNGEASKVFKIDGAGYATIRTELYNQSCDTFIELYTDSALTNKVTEDDDRAGNRYSLITGFYLNWGRPYYLKVRNFNNGQPTYARVTVQFQ
ncbi:hypothetical protein GK047_15330 [Paenibacillus sp. SYP-B3998]|uniref:Phosphodiester glycosidase family protein n=1 Tax=Paenibacillus sp. SYP-B3998 TaxID=2678564 RepID=A0A6G3ZZ34_9BACL|nr:phosphodiester glycosidase family protein [Paenibacillus sp. SYP-B3998]NEW07375.1 hypothetical protein [Paenibacillus sp. SYP-B3998]